MKKIIPSIVLMAIFMTAGYSTNAFAENFSMRNCMLLPITDTAGNSFSFRVYEDVERYLKDRKWCQYKSSSEVLEIFSKYRDKLPEFLSDPKVIRSVADRLEVGTIIKVKMQYDVDKLNLELEVLGENGVDIYFSEKIVLNKIDAYAVNTTITNWLDLYETSIPYMGRVVGVLGEQITFNFAKSKQVSIGQDFTVKRFVKKRRHPLLKKIVEWDSSVIAKGKVFNLSRGQALGVIKLYTGNKKINVGDWIRLERMTKEILHGHKVSNPFQEHKFGRLGDFSLAVGLSSNSIASNTASGEQKMGGLLFGLSGEFETWVTRNYFVAGEFSKRIGDVDKKSGSSAPSSSGQNETIFKVTGGYKYLPMGFFYGPQINFYTGWGRYSYTLDTTATAGLGVNDISGIILGVGGNVPLRKGIRIFASGEIIPFGEFNDEDNLFGRMKSLSSMVLEFGTHYQWTPTVRILGSFEMINNSVSFSGTNTRLTYSDTSLKLGGVFSF